MKTQTEREQEITAAFPWLPQDEIARKAAHAAKADHHATAVEALINAAADPVKARELWHKNFPRGGGSSELWRARRRKFAAILVNHSLLSREELAELESNDDDASRT